MELKRRKAVGYVSPMNTQTLILGLVIAAFAALTGLALGDVGYWGIIEPHFQSWGAAQVLADLVIACLLACVWMQGDSRRSGVAAWPFILLTLVGGSFGILSYLLVRARQSSGGAVAQA